MRNFIEAALCGASIFTLSVQIAVAQTAPDSATGGEAQTAPRANAQASPGQTDGSDPLEVIVTARRRDESSISVPVSIQAFGATQLARYDTKSFEDLARQVPGLALQTNYNPTATVYLRGVGSVPQNSTGEQSVGFVLDGVSAGGSGTLRPGQIDVASVEVLKGPQPLFFGKNTTAGVISIRTADPGDRSEISLIGGYGFQAREKTLQVVASGPVTDTLGLRVVGYVNYADGFFKNNALVIPSSIAGNTVPAAQGAPRDRGPYRKEQLIRATALFQPSPGLTVRAKYMFNNAHAGSTLDNIQRFYCANALPQTAGLVVNDSCNGDRYTPNGRFSPAITAQFPGQFTFQGLRFRQHLGTLNVRYEVAPQIAITSDTGIYRYREDNFGNSNASSVPLLYGGAHTRRKNFTEEIRVLTSKDWPINFTGGLFYEDKREQYQSFAVIDAFALGRAASPGLLGVGNLTPGIYFPRTKAYSAFLQATLKITNTLELAGGARYSEEHKQITITTDAGVPVVNVRPRVKFSNTSPEVTLSYRPTGRLTIYAGYRQGFKSGGFNTAPGGSLTADRTFEPERVKGGEAGIKARIGEIRVNLDGYYYTYSNLQVSRFDNVTATFTLQNAARSRVKGIEGDVQWQPRSLRGFDAHASFNYNKARYLDFIGACFIGQTVAEGCNRLPGASGAFTSQDLAGKPIVNSPLWAGNVGAGYTRDVGSLRYGGSIDAFYSSAYFAQFEEAPHGLQRKNVQLNASIRVGSTDDHWQVALIGKNLTNIYRTNLVAQPTGSGRSTLTGTNTVGGRADLSGYFNPGRQISIQISSKF